MTTLAFSLAVPLRGSGFHGDGGSGTGGASGFLVLVAIAVVIWLLGKFFSR